MSDPYSFDPSTQDDSTMGATATTLAPGGSPSLAPGADTEAPFRKEMEDMRKRALQQSERLGNQAEQQIGQNADTARRKQEALKPLREQEMAQASQPLPQPPQSQPLPPVPSNQMSDADNAWLNAAMFLGSLAGGLTRNHVTNALAGMTGAVEGYTQGRKDLFQQQMDIWKAANDRALKENDRSQKAYETVLKNRQLSMDQKMMQVQITAQQFDDEAMAGAAAQKDTIAVAQLADQRARYATEMKGASTALDEQRIGMAKQEAAGMTDVMQKIANAEMPMPSVNGRSPYNNALNQALIQGALRINPSLTASDYAVKKNEAMIPSRAAGAGATAAARTAGVAGTNIELVMRSAGPVIEMAGNASQDVPRTVFPRINEIMNTAANEIGDPKIKTFRLANEELAELWARTLNPRSSIVTVSGMQNARERITTADSPEAYAAMLAQLKQFIEREYTAVQDQKHGVPLAPINVPGAGSSTLGGAASSMGEKVGTAVDRSLPPKGVEGVPAASWGDKWQSVKDAAGAVGSEFQREVGDLRGVYNDPSQLLETPDWLRNMLPEGWVVTDRWVKKKPGMKGDMPIPPEK
jgi:hypothetical protein